MKRNILSVLLASLVWTGCPAKKKDPGQGSEPVKDSVRASTGQTEDDGATSLDELVYEARGASVLKKESLARSQAELKGRVALITMLSEDAGQLVRAFAPSHPQFFEKAVDADDFAKKISKHMQQGTTLKGSRVGEYETESDTTFASVEISLMNGYEAIESAVVEVGKETGIIGSSQLEGFQKAFRSFFIEEKNKLLTLPS